MKISKFFSLMLCLSLASACSASQYTQARQTGYQNDHELRNHVKLCHFAIPQSYGEPVPRSEAVENSYFDDAAFAGDSRIAGIAELYVLADTTARIYGSVSLDVSKATMRTVFPLDNGGMGTMIDALAQTPVQKIYLSFGLNELGWYVMDIFKEDYIDIVNQIKALQPQAQIYLLDVYNFSKSREYENDYTNLDKLKLINDTIKEVAAETQVNLIHSNSMFESEDTYLPDEWTSDGYHLNKEGFSHWLTMIKEHVNKEEILYETKPCAD